VLDELPDEFNHVVLAVKSLFKERLEGCHRLLNLVLLKRNQLKGQELANVLGEKLFLLELAWVHSLNSVKQVNLLSGVGGDKEVKNEVAEGLSTQFTICVKFCLQFFVFGLIDCVVHGLVSLRCLHNLFLVDPIAYHKAKVGNLLLLQTFLTNGSLADLTAEDLSANVVLACQSQLHLIKNEVDLLFVLKRPIGLNLDLLNDLGSIIDLAISLIHLDELFRSLGVFALEENFSLGGCPQSVKHVEALLT